MGDLFRLATIVQDIRYAVRRLISAPGFTVATIVILALGIGANSALFTALDRTVLRPLPYPNPDRLVALWEDYSALTGSPKNRVSPGTFVDWRKRAQTFEEIAAYSGPTVRDLSGGGTPEEIRGVNVTAGLLPMLGVQPLLGRTFTEPENAPGVKLVVLGYRLWRRRFDGDPNVIGRDILMSSEKYTVIGVMPRGFQFPNVQTEYWLPLGLTPDIMARRNSHFLFVFGRQKPGRSISEAQVDMNGIARDLAKEFPRTNTSIGITVVPLQDEFVGDRGNTFVILLCAASCVLLIACANVANLLLARATARQREIAVRTALGASPGRVLRQILTENLMLSAAGGAFGLLVARWISNGLESMIPQNLSGIVNFNLDWRAIAFTLVISIVSGVLFGIAPAIRLSNGAISDVLKAVAPGNVTQGGGRLRDVLVVGEIAIALVLVVGAVLLIQTLSRLRSVDSGFHAAGVLTAHINLSAPKYQEYDKRQRFYSFILDNVRAIPGVKSAGLTSDLPYTSQGNTMGITIEGRQLPNPNAASVLFRLVSADYLETIGARMLQGRLLLPSDRMENEPVVVINETLANLYWPNESALGRRIDTGTGDGAAKWMTIVGVVRDVRERGLDLASKGAVYVPFTQTTIGFFLPSEIAVLTSRDPLSLTKELQGAVWSVDPEQPLSNIATMDSIVEGELSGRTQVLTILGAFAGLALLLAAFGAYSVLSYVVSLRSREIGLRMALGANPWDIARPILWYAAQLAAVGIVIGLMAAFAVTRLLSSLLFGISPVDPATFAAVSLGLFTVAILASLTPIARSTRADPMTTLRAE